MPQYTHTRTHRQTLYNYTPIDRARPTATLTDLGTLFGNHGHGGTSDVAGTHATDLEIPVVTHTFKCRLIVVWIIILCSGSGQQLCYLCVTIRWNVKQYATIKDNGDDGRWELYRLYSVRLASSTMLVWVGAVRTNAYHTCVCVWVPYIGDWNVRRARVRGGTR
jgi:hypothetical protein